MKDANLDSVVAVNRVAKVRDYFARGTAPGYRGGITRLKRRKCDGGRPLAMMMCGRGTSCVVSWVVSVYAVEQRRGRFWDVWDESLGRAQRRLGGLGGP